MVSKLRRKMGLANAARVRSAISNMATAAGGGTDEDGSLARVLSEVGHLIENVDASVASYERGSAVAVPCPESKRGGEWRSVNERIEQEISAGAQALDSLQKAFSGLLRVNAPCSAEGFPYRRLPASAARLAAPPDRAVAIIPESARGVRNGAAMDALFVCGLDADGKPGRFVEVNEVACRLLGYTRDELLGMSFADIDGTDGGRVVADVLAGRGAVAETVHVAKDGRRIPVEIHAHELDFDERPAVLALARDLAGRQHSDDQLRLWQKAFSASAEAIVITDNQERILSANPAVTAITGYTAEEVLGKTPRIFQSGQHDKDFYREMWAAIIATGHWHGEITDRRKNGEIYPKWLSISAVPDQQGRVTHYIASFTDITARKNNDEQIRYLAYHDPLTGLPNRRRLKERFELEIAHARRNGCKLHLLFLDLDHFKEINDTLGHAVGDKFLQAVTTRLKGCLRVTDIISRLGGDEFVIVLSDTHGVVDLGHIVDKLLGSLDTPFDIEGNLLKASTSMGIGVFPDDGEDFETLLHKADTAMYQAKRKGRGGYLYFDDGMNAQTHERVVMESHLRGALDQGEIFLHYQPRADLGDRRVAGVEALLRWESPILGTVDPDRFIPLAEDCGLMSQIGEWALREVCRQAKAWHEAGWPDLTVALKLVPAQYRRPDLVDVLARALADSGVDPRCIELGFSEASMVQGRDATMETARRIKALGVRLFLDGFGTGCSSLAFLKQSAVDQIKIDGALIAGLPGNNGELVRAAIQMATCLKLGIVADGIGEEAQIDFLRDAGCELGQGPLFGHPHPDPLSLSA